MMLKVVGMGDVEVTMIMGDKKLDSVFKNVLYIPQIAKNLFLVSKKTSLSNVFEFNKIFCVIKKDEKVVGVGLCENRLYRLNCNVKLHGGKSASDINGPTIVIPKQTYAKVARVATFHMHEVENAQVIEAHGGGNIDLWHR